MPDLILGGVTVEVTAPSAPNFEVVAPATTAVVVGVQGPPGPVSSNHGQPRFSGDGPPGTIIGSQVGDEYLDRASGLIYTLQGWQE